MSHRHRPIKYAIAMAMTLLTLSARGQEYLTKSWTSISPAERPATQIPLPSKSPTPLTHQTAGTYIAVTRPDLLAAVEPLLQWRRQQGYDVETICVETNQRDSIRALLQMRYDNATALHPAQRYVLIVGDVDRIPAFNGRHTPSELNAHVTDLYYGEYSGDYMPEAMVGRLSVRDSTELSAVVRKIIDYEQGRWAASQMLLAAGRESRTPAPTTTNGQVHYIAGLMSEMLDTVCFYNPESDSLREALLAATGQGNALINYTGHCTRNGWNNPTIGFADIDTLTDAAPTIYINNCCLSNAFNGTCFGEQLLRAPQAGAVGVIGATNETLWAEDYYWAVGAKYPLSLYPPYNSALGGAFDGLAGANGYTLGEMLYNGCQAVTLAGSPFDAFYWETYCLLGDPATNIFAGTPDTLFLSHTDTLLQGCTELTLTASPGCRVSATQKGRLLGSAIAHADSTVTLRLASALIGDSVTLTASQPGFVGRSITAPTFAPTTGQWAATSCQIDSNDVLTLDFQHIGPSLPTGHRARLYQTEDDMSIGTILNTESLPTWTIGSTQQLIPLSATGTRAPLLAIHLDLASGDTTYSSQQLLLEPPCQTAKHISIESLSDELRPNHGCHLAITLSHTPDSMQLTINGMAYQPTSCESNDHGQPVCHYSFNISDSQEPLHLESKTFRQGWADSVSQWMLPYKAMEHFESADFNSFPWQNSLLYPWQIDSATSHDGRLCARSGAIGNALRSVLSLDIDVMHADSISFYLKVSSEANDWLYFFLDGERRGYWSGNKDWKYYTRPLSAGRHRLQWIYQKDAAGSNGYDCAWIDDIHLPEAWWQQPCGIPDADTARDLTITIPTHTIFNICPNPTSNVVTINIPQLESPTEIKVFDCYGRLADKIFIPQNCPTTQYFTTHLRCGIYSLMLHTPDGASIQKLIITR